MDDVIKPFADAGMPAEGWDELAESVEHVRPLAAQALLAVFRRTHGRRGRARRSPNWPAAWPSANDK